MRALRICAVALTIAPATDAIHAEDNAYDYKRLANDAKLFLDADCFPQRRWQIDPPDLFNLELTPPVRVIEPRLKALSESSWAINTESLSAGPKAGIENLGKISNYQVWAAPKNASTGVINYAQTPAELDKLPKNKITPCIASKEAKPTKKRKPDPREHRRNDPDTIEASESGAKFESSFGSILIGGPTKSKKCVQAIRALSKVGLADSFLPRRSNYSNEQNAAEDSFSAECLSKTLISPSSSVGVLSLSDAAFCTGVLLTRRIVLTARHCIFREDDADRLTVSMREEAWSMKWHFWPSTMEGHVIYGQTRVYLPIGPTTNAWVGYRIASSALPDVNIPESYWKRDFALVELSRDAHEPAELEIDHPRPGEELIPVAAYAPAWGQGLSTEAPLRTQTAGACKVLEVRMNGCVVHGCSMSGGASGAPLFAKRISGAETKYVLVGFHESGTATATGCEARGWGGAVNFGLSASYVFSALVAGGKK